MSYLPLDGKLIQELSTIHNNYYEYIKKEGSYLYILCPVHGEFKQRLDHHKNRHGCKTCGSIEGQKYKVLNRENLLKKLKEVHGNRYKYNLTEITYKAKDKFEVICSEHGSFFTTYDQHINKKTNCKQCSQLKINQKNTKSNAEFITQALNVHNNLYTYEFCKYIKDKEKVTITCKKHGNFIQKASNHLQGKGCMKCSKEMNIFTLESFKKYCNKNNNGLGIFYIIQCFKNDEVFYKLRNYF